MATFQSFPTLTTELEDRVGCKERAYPIPIFWVRSKVQMDATYLMSKYLKVVSKKKTEQ